MMMRNHGENFQHQLNLNDEIIIDNFAGGGGASTGIELALGRQVDVAINHDPEAIAMHQANHPQTRHYCESVWDVDPREMMPGRKIGALWLSPDCKHFSKAKGGKPVEKKIRGLAWVALRWAALRKPRVIMLENVEEFITWGPLHTKHTNGCTGNHPRPMFKDNGDPIEWIDGKTTGCLDDCNFGHPIKEKKGATFNTFVNALKHHGYHVEWEELRACDYGAPTIRKRLFLIARCDGQPIVWPEPTHGDPKSEAVKSGRLKPWRTAAECIEWEIPCPSIFLTKEEGRAIGVNRPLADATLRRIAKGIMRYVVNTAKPFIVTNTTGHPGAHIDEPLRTVTTGGHHALVIPFITEHANGSKQRNMPADEPLRTQCAQVKGGHFALVVPTLIETGYGEREGQAPRAPGLNKPLGTVVSGGGKHALVSAFMAKHYGGVVGHTLHDDPLHTVTSKDHNTLVIANLMRHFGQSVGSKVEDPVGTVTPGGQGKTALVTSNLVKLRNNCIGQDNREPLHTITGGAEHFAEVRAFLVKYYGNEQDGISLNEPNHTVTARDRFGLVTVHGEEYAIADIGLRMLTPRELFRAQGFPDSYIIDRGLHIDEHSNHHWKPLSKSAQVRMCGNSVCPPLAAALVRANCKDMIAGMEKSA